MAAEAVGDFDGDGAADRFVVYTTGLGTFWPRVELSYGYAAVAPMPTPGHAVVDVLGVSIGGPADLAVSVSAFAPGIRAAAFWVVRDCGLDAVREDDGEFAAYGLHDEELLKEGVTCRADGIDVTEASSSDGVTWRASVVGYVWDSAAGELVGQVGAARLLYSPEDDAEILTFADWNC